MREKSVWTEGILNEREKKIDGPFSLWTNLPESDQNIIETQLNAQTERDLFLSEPMHTSPTSEGDSLFLFQTHI